MGFIFENISVLILVLVIILSVCFKFFSVTLWISALAAGVKVNILSIGKMRFRKIDPSVIIYPLIIAHKAGLDISLHQLENHYLAGGDAKQLVNGLIAARRTNVDWSFERIAEMDLSGRDVLEEVQNRVSEIEKEE